MNCPFFEHFLVFCNNHLNPSGLNRILGFHNRDYVKKKHVHERQNRDYVKKNRVHERKNRGYVKKNRVYERLYLGLFQAR